MRKFVGIFAVLFALLSMGCGAAVCQTERSIVSGFDTGIAVTDNVLGDSVGSDWDVILQGAKEATELGRVAVDLCENLRDGAGWREFVESALPLVNTAMWFIETLAGPEHIIVPDELRASASALRQVAIEIDIKDIESYGRRE